MFPGSWPRPPSIPSLTAAERGGPGRSSAGSVPSLPPGDKVTSPRCPQALPRSMSVKPSAVMASAVFLSMFSRHRLASCGSSNSRAYEGQHINIQPRHRIQDRFPGSKLVTDFKSQGLGAPTSTRGREVFSKFTAYVTTPGGGSSGKRPCWACSGSGMETEAADRADPKGGRPVGRGPHSSAEPRLV